MINSAIQEKSKLFKYDTNNMKDRRQRTKLL